MKALAILVKNPVEGLVKTRLAASIGNSNAVEVYIDLLKHTQKVAKNFDHVFVFHAPDLNDAYVWNFAQNEVQIQGDLGAKMLNVFQTIFSKKYTEVVLIGSDCFDLTINIIDKAFAALSSNDVVYGPAVDGGYYLIGLKNKAPKSLFKGIPWSSPEVLGCSLQVLLQEKLSYELLQELNDVDEYADLPAGYKAKYPKSS